MNAEELFLKKYGNKITASESWVIRFAEEYADLKTKLAESLSVKQEKKKGKDKLILFAEWLNDNCDVVKGYRNQWEYKKDIYDEHELVAFYLNENAPTEEENKE